jgi:transcriptional regulator
MSQNRNAADRAGVAAGLAASDGVGERAMASLIPS